MDIAEAKDIVFKAVDRSSLRAVAADIGVSHPILSRWRPDDGTVPTGKNRERVIDWAERHQQKRRQALKEASTPYGDNAPPSVPLSEIVRRTTENLQSLAEVRAYAVAVRNMIWNAGHQQDRVVELLAPHVEREAQQAEETARRFAKEHAPTRAKDIESSHRDKGAGGPRTASPRGGKGAE